MSNQVDKNKKVFSKIITCITMAAAFISAATIPGLPKKFTFSINPLRDGTAWYVNATHARLYKDNGKSWCEYLGDLVFPAMYDDRVKAYFCPAITIRHISSIEIRRSNGKCRGMVCGYDIAVPGGGYMLTTDLVEYCPDIIATAIVNGIMKLVAAKDFSLGEDATPYFRNGTLIDLHFDTEPLLVDKCGGDRYRKQLNYWLGTSLKPGDRRNIQYVEDVEWDGL